MHRHELIRLHKHLRLRSALRTRSVRVCGNAASARHHECCAELLKSLVALVEAGVRQVAKTKNKPNTIQSKQIMGLNCKELGGGGDHL